MNGARKKRGARLAGRALEVVRGENNNTSTVPDTSGMTFLIHGKHRPRVVGVVSCPYCRELHLHLGAAGTVKKAPCGGGSYRLSVNAVYSRRAS